MSESETTSPTADRTAAERFLRAFHQQGVARIFANLGTDHTPLLEAAADVRRAGDGDQIPEIISCPHEFAAMSAAHGCAAVTGDPQVVLVHVDVGTQNLGAAMHNAHRAGAPVFVLAGLAPVTDAGHSGSRDHPVHYFQDVFDQPGIVREYSRWIDQYRPPADPAETVRRGLERAVSEPSGPVYVTATREALSGTVDATPSTATVRRVGPGGADTASIDRLVSEVERAERPAVITSDLGRSPAGERVDALVSFAEAAGAGVVEQTPTTLCFPRDHEQHLGYDPTVALERADLVVLADADVPWIPGPETSESDATVVQIDPNPTKPAYPRWPFAIDETVQADAAATLEAVEARLHTDADSSRAFWRDIAAERRADAADRLAADTREGRLTPTVLSNAVESIVDGETVVVEDAVTSRPAIMSQIELSTPGSYFWKGGAGLGWAGGAAVGAKLANPDNRVIALVGDGSYLFANPSACALLAAEYDAPTLTVVYDNQGWNAVEGATTAQYPDGAAAEESVPESHFGTTMDLSAPASVVDAHTRVVHDPDELPAALEEAAAAVDAGRPAVLDVKVERP
ncbi:thiamine pyrophosphate-requiring protein [Halobellus captivus]|uniref:thiamine pyrophosphate-requiring protein n=1 Tax=Halobellus captivus TaxID=2592614 RepID=UPI0011A9C6AD|nr:thiamine pyrophosphate-requiring protein [Halobellus captivus]